MRKAKNPAAGKRQGSSKVVCFPARDYQEPTTNHPSVQPPIAVLVLAHRARVAVETAKVFAELNGYGEAR